MPARQTRPTNIRTGGSRLSERIEANAGLFINDPVTPAARPQARTDRYRSLTDAIRQVRLGNVGSLDPALIAYALEEAATRLKQEFIYALADRLTEILLGEANPSVTALAMAHGNPSLLDAVRDDMGMVVAMVNAAHRHSGHRLIERAPTPEEAIAGLIPGITDNPHWKKLQALEIVPRAQAN